MALTRAELMNYLNSCCLIRDQPEFISRGVEFFEGGGIHFRAENLGAQI